MIASADALRRALKKLRSLTRIKIELAEDHGTEEVDVSPLPLVERYFGERIETVEDAWDFYEEYVVDMPDVRDVGEVARLVMACFDVIEGVKHEFEPPELVYLSPDVSDVEGVVLEVMTDDPEPGVFYVGEPPEGVEVRHVGRVVSTLARFLPEAEEAGLLDVEDLSGVEARFGRFTLLSYATAVALRGLGAVVKTPWGVEEGV
ncbi:MAG: hypothetical protein GXO28_01100 [Methanopyri archaeon]|nr:hypothetical protein [Methanopyri archaeon]